MGLFSNMRDAKIIERGQYFPPVKANYLLEVASGKYIKTRKSNEMLVFEFNVIESDNTRPLEEGGVPVGTRRDWSIMKSSDYFDGDLLGFVIAMFGLVPGPRDNAAIEAWKQSSLANPHDPMSLDQITEDMVDGRKQSMLGMRIRLETLDHTTKEKKTLITLHHFRPFYASKAEAEQVYRANLARGPLAAPPPPVQSAATPPPPPGAPPGPPPPPPNPTASWTRSPDGAWMLNPGTNQWEAAR